MINLILDDTIPFCVLAVFRGGGGGVEAFSDDEDDDGFGEAMGADLAMVSILWDITNEFMPYERVNNPLC
jgi:hypothetical protein